MTSSLENQFPEIDKLSVENQEKLVEKAGKIKNNLISILELAKEIVDNHSNKTDLTSGEMLLITTGFSLLNSVSVAKNFILSSLNMDKEDDICHDWKMAIEKNEDFLMSRVQEIFGNNEIVKPYIDKVTLILQNKDKNGENCKQKILTDEDKEYLWDLFKAIVWNAVKVVHYFRNPTLKDRIVKYEFELIPEIKIGKLMREYEIPTLD